MRALHILATIREHSCLSVAERPQPQNPLASVAFNSITINSLSVRFANAYTGAVARVVYSRAFPSLTKPQTGRLNKSPHTVHAIANRRRWNLPQFAVIVPLR